MLAQIPGYFLTRFALFGCLVDELSQLGGDARVECKDNPVFLVLRFLIIFLALSCVWLGTAMLVIFDLIFALLDFTRELVLFVWPGGWDYVHMIAPEPRTSAELLVSLIVTGFLFFVMIWATSRMLEFCDRGKE